MDMCQALLFLTFTATFLQWKDLNDFAESMLPSTLLSYGHIRWKLKPETSPKPRQTWKRKVFPKPVLPLDPFIHPTFASFCLHYLSRSGFWHTAPWLRWFPFSPRPVSWDNSAQPEQFQGCAQPKLRHMRLEYIQTLGTHGPFSPTIWLVCPYCSASRISAWFFSPEKTMPQHSSNQYLT